MYVHYWASKGKRNLKQNGEAGERGRTGLAEGAGDAAGEELRHRSNLVLLVHRRLLVVVVVVRLQELPGAAVDDGTAVARHAHASFHTPQQQQNVTSLNENRKP